jgi:hypothetical protein
MDKKDHGVVISVKPAGSRADRAASRRPASDHEERARLLAIELAAIDTVLGPLRLPCGESYQAELHRVRGELLLERDGLAAAEEALACFQQALQLGRDQGALAWELRAAMSLVRLRERQGDAFAAELAEARQRLREVYGRFTEGFDFPDLQDAAALIGNHPRQGIGEAQQEPGARTPAPEFQLTALPTLPAARTPPRPHSRPAS